MLSLGIGVGITSIRNNSGSISPPPPPPPSFDPADLWTASEAGGFWDFSDLSTLKVARDGTGAAPAVGDVVGHAVDQGPNALALETESDSARPTAVQTGSRIGLRFDGLADYLQTASALSQTSCTIIVAATAFGVSDASDGLFGLSTVGAGSTRTFQLNAGNATEFRARLQNNTIPSIAAQSGAVSGVMTLIMDQTAETIVLRDDGVQIGTVSGFTQNMQTRKMIFGADRTRTYPLGVDIGGIIHIGKALSGSDLTDAETWATARLVQ